MTSDFVPCCFKQAANNHLRPVISLLTTGNKRFHTKISNKQRLKKTFVDIIGMKIQMLANNGV